MSDIDQAEEVELAVVSEFLDECNLRLHEEESAEPTNCDEEDEHEPPPGGSHTTTEVETDASVNATAVSSGEGSDDATQWSTVVRRVIQHEKAARRRNRYRKKLKNEKVMLLARASELSTKLSTMKAAIAADEEEEEPDELAMSVWRAIATRQMELRQQTEKQNERLKAAVANRSKLIYQLNALLVASNQADTLSFHEIIVDEETGGDLLLKAFVCELDALYTQTAEVFRGVDISSPATSGPTKKHSRGVYYFELTDVSVVAFDFEETSRSLSLLVLADMKGCHYRADTDDPDNTSARKYTLRYRSDPISTSVAVRRYQEDNRMVFVWRGLFEGQGEFQDYQADVTGWVAAQPMAGAQQKDATVIMCYLRLVPVKLGSDGMSETIADRFARAILRAKDKECKELMEMLEKMLLNTRTNDA